MTPPSERLRCVVAGAGLGGLAAAIALRRAGHEVVVLEQAPALGTVGAGIQMAPNASRLLEAWGVVGRFGGAGVKAVAAVRRRWNDGEILGEVPLGAELIARVGASYWCLHRADLHAALVATATAEDDPGVPVEIRLDTTVTGVVANGPGQARVTTLAGDEVAGDLVVGADGIRSRVREALFPGHTPAFSGRVTNRHVLDGDLLRQDATLLPLLERPIQSIWLGPGGHVITHPIRGGADLYMGVTTSGLTDEEAFWSTPVDKDALEAKVAGWDPRIARMIDAAPTITAYGLHDSAPMPEWSEGRVCLLGDACHAMLPFQAQGAAQAIEDGAVLGEALTSAGTNDVVAAIARYVEARQPRTARVQQASRANGAQWHLPDGPQQQRRDAALATGSGDFESYEWLWEVGPGQAPAPAPDANEA